MTIDLSIMIIIFGTSLVHKNFVSFEISIYLSQWNLQIRTSETTKFADYQTRSKFLWAMIFGKENLVQNPKDLI